MVKIGLRILEAIRKTYKRDYIGLLVIKKLCPFGYMVSFGLNSPNKTPVSIALEIEGIDEFIKQFIEELRTCKFHDSRYFTTRLCYELDGICRCALKVKVIYDNNNCCETDTIILSTSEVWIPYNRGPLPIDIISMSNWYIDNIINWDCRDGNIIVSVDRFNDRILIDSDVINESLDLTQEIKLYNGSGHVTIKVHLLGLRELFKDVDNKQFITFNGLTFNVIKDKYKNEYKQ